MSNITVIVPTSPIEAHPSTELIEETIGTIRTHLPDSEIIITIDGVREEQEKWRKQYNKYIHLLMWKCLHKYKSVLPIPMEQHSHQSGMLAVALDEVKTDLVLYVEHDAPLTPDRAINWDEVQRFIYKGDANTVRFHHENVIPKEHEHLMLETRGDFTKTYQWSQRPHLSTKIYYQDTILPTLPERSFIEDTFHGIVANDYLEHGELGWNKHRLWIYTPDGGIQRSYHTDGRGNAPKFTSDDDKR